ncbi:uncharacterized protein LOC26527807 isoform X2 [Drosophila mojavensis]|uniref:uncharacterized protein LOC26527807 isoform X2 n=1 Tax=Drosophila mojavensis TaxID=7230 RepID=UPI0013EEE4A3|nr:uncharacterized protein LOC26527807 isoform X2 [Drosophila mojavensis]
MMAVLKISILIFIYSSLKFLYLVPNVMAGDAVCLNCESFRKCSVPVGFLSYADFEDEHRVIDKRASDPADEELDDCLSPKKKISGIIKGAICSGGTDGLCRPIISKSNLAHDDTSCRGCWVKCPCNAKYDRAVCLNCKALKDCKVPADFVAFAESADESKLVDKAANDPADGKMDVCLGPKKKISGTLTNVICSGGTDGYCHAIAMATNNMRTLNLHCAMCQEMCPCKESKGSVLREAAIFVPICLVHFTYWYNTFL